MVGKGGRAIAGERPEHAACSDVDTDAGTDERQEDDNEEAESARTGRGGLKVYLCKRDRVSVGQESIKVFDAVEDGNQVEEGGEETNKLLHRDGLWDIDPRLGDFFRQMGDTVRYADGERSVQHAGKECEAIRRVTRLIQEVTPDKGVGGMPTAIRAGHYGADENGHEAAGEDEEQSNLVYQGQGAVGE